jgi:hypothetical protein
MHSARWLAPDLIEDRAQAGGVRGPVGQDLEATLPVGRHQGDLVSGCEPVEILPEPAQDQSELGLHREALVDEDQQVAAHRPRDGRGRNVTVHLDGRAAADLGEVVDGDFLAVDQKTEVRGLQALDALAAAIGDDRLHVDDADVDRLADLDVRTGGSRLLRGQGQRAGQEQQRDQGDGNLHMVLLLSENSVTQVSLSKTGAGRKNLF